MVYPLEIPGLDGHSSDLLENCLGGGLRGLIHDESLRLLAHYSGGIPRYFVQYPATRMGAIFQNTK